MNDNKASVTTDEIIERGMRDLRNDTLAAAIEICETVERNGGSAMDCIRAVERLRDSLNDSAPAEQIR